MLSKLHFILTQNASWGLPDDALDCLTDFVWASRSLVSFFEYYRVNMITLKETREQPFLTPTFASECFIFSRNLCKSRMQCSTNLKIPVNNVLFWLWIAPRASVLVERVGVFVYLVIYNFTDYTTWGKTKTNKERTVPIDYVEIDKGLGFIMMLLRMKWDFKSKSLRKISLHCKSNLNAEDW